MVLGSHSEVMLLSSFGKTFFLPQGPTLAQQFPSDSSGYTTLQTCTESDFWKGMSVEGDAGLFLQYCLAVPPGLCILGLTESFDSIMAAANEERQL